MAYLLSQVEQADRLPVGQLLDYPLMHRDILLSRFDREVW
jgi:hypothetical protein